jgi:hypothetical protein
MSFFSREEQAPLDVAALLAPARLASGVINPDCLFTQSSAVAYVPTEVIGSRGRKKRKIYVAQKPWVTKIIIMKRLSWTITV